MRRGFEAMDKDTLRAVSAKGGKAAHEKGTAHKYDSSEARIAGAKGGRVRAERARLARENNTKQENTNGEA